MYLEPEWQWLVSGRFCNYSNEVSLLRPCLKQMNRIALISTRGRCHQDFWSIKLDDLWSKKVCGPKMIVWSGATFILRWFCSPLKKNEILIFLPSIMKKRIWNQTKGWPLYHSCVCHSTYEELWIFASMKTFSHWSLLSFPSDSLLTWIDIN